MAPVIVGLLLLLLVGLSLIGAAYLIGGVIGVAALLGGLVAYITAPLVAGLIGWHGLGQWYGKLGMLALDRGVVLAREHGGYDLFVSWWDPEDLNEKISLDGEELDFYDPGGCFSYLYDRTLGIANEGAAIIRYPVHAEVGAAVGELVETNKRSISTVANINGQAKRVVAHAKHVVVPEEPAVVDPTGLNRILPGSADPESRSRAKEHTIKSQAEFGQSASMLKIGAVAGQYFIALIATWWVASDLQGGGADAVVNETDTVISGSLAAVELVGVVG